MCMYLLVALVFVQVCLSMCVGWFRPSEVKAQCNYEKESSEGKVMLFDMTRLVAWLFLFPTKHDFEKEGVMWPNRAADCSVPQRCYGVHFCLLSSCL